MTLEQIESLTEKISKELEMEVLRGEHPVEGDTE
jgi:hypothetical protein